MASLAGYDLLLSGSVVFTYPRVQHTQPFPPDRVCAVQAAWTDFDSLLLRHKQHYNSVTRLSFYVNNELIQGSP